MGAIGIFLALVALIIAIFGYRLIQDWVRDKVEEMAKIVVDNLMNEERMLLVRLGIPEYFGMLK